MAVTAPSRTGRFLRAALVVQVGLAALVVGVDLLRASEGGRLFPARAAPPVTVPVGPGDQTRRFDPRTLPDTRPDMPDMPRLPNLPARLRFTDTLQDGLPVLMIEGRISPGDAARFEEHLARAPQFPERISLHSPGGSVSDALEIGRRIRSEGAEVSIDEGAACLSACPYILAGGVARHVASSAMVGVHQHYFDRNTLLPAFVAVESIQRGQGEVLDFLAEMGIDLRLMGLALKTPPESIYILLEEELHDLRVITDPDAPLAEN
ncbi:MAG: hypothetical protein ACXIU7_09050 [Roseinatronobacter sp.]